MGERTLVDGMKKVPQKWEQFLEIAVRKLNDLDFMLATWFGMSTMAKHLLLHGMIMKRQTLGCYYI